MEKNELNDFETFYEFPEKYIKINYNSSYYLITKNNKKVVAKRNFDSLSYINILGKNRLIKEKSYYDVITGDIVTKVKSISNEDGSNEEFLVKEKKLEINSLARILNIKENDVYYLSKEDIESLIDYKEEKVKTYNLKPKKQYN